MDEERTISEHDLSKPMAIAALAAVLATLDVAIGVFPDEMKAMHILDDLHLCAAILQRELKKANASNGIA